MQNGVGQFVRSVHLAPGKRHLVCCQEDMRPAFGSRPAAKPVELGRAHLDSPDDNSYAFEKRYYVRAGALTNLPVAPQVERNPLDILIAKLLVARPVEHVRNVNTGKINIMLECRADFLQPMHLSVLIVDVPDQRACQRSVKDRPSAIKHRAKKKLAAHL